MPVAQTDIAASQTDTELVAAKTGHVIAVRAFFASCGGTATTIVLNSKGTGAGTAISPVFANGANGDTSLAQRGGNGWFQTNVGEALTATTGAGSQSGVVVDYEYLPG